MRKLVILSLVTLSFGASAQTPAQLANQVWPFGPPAYTGSAPASTGAGGGSATGRDLARLLWPAGAPKIPGDAASPRSTYAQSFTGNDLSRLRNGPSTAPAVSTRSVPTLAASSETPAIALRVISP